MPIPFNSRSSSLIWLTERGHSHNIMTRGQSIRLISTAAEASARMTPSARALIRILMLTRLNAAYSYTRPQLSGPIHPLNKFLRYLFVLFACLQLAGGPYSLMQAYAWMNMIFDYSKESSFSQAVTDTFSGEKPCCLCKKIKAAEADDNKQKTPLSPLASKPVDHLFPPSEINLRDPLHTPFSHHGFAPVAQSNSRINCSPPSPPPKSSATPEARIFLQRTVPLYT